MKGLFFRDVKFHRVQGNQKPPLYYLAHRDGAQPSSVPRTAAVWILTPLAPVAGSCDFFSRCLVPAAGSGDGAAAAAGTGTRPW